MSILEILWIIRRLVVISFCVILLVFGIKKAMDFKKTQNARSKKISIVLIVCGVLLLYSMFFLGDRANAHVNIKSVSTAFDAITKEETDIKDVITIKSQKGIVADVIVNDTDKMTEPYEYSNEFPTMSSPIHYNDEESIAQTVIANYFPKAKLLYRHGVENGVEYTIYPLYSGRQTLGIPTEYTGKIDAFLEVKS